MKLTVDGIGKIRETKIDLDGITVIAGPNNTGKSTIGKSLFALVNAQYNYAEKVRSYIREQIDDALETYSSVSGSSKVGYVADWTHLNTSMRKSLFSGRKVHPLEIKNWLLMRSENISITQNDFGLGSLSKDMVRQAYKELAGDSEEARNFQRSCANILSQNEDDFRKHFAANEFSEIFNGQFSSLLPGSLQRASVKLSDSEGIRATSATFIDEECMEATARLGAQYAVLMIADPNSLDRIFGDGRYYPMFRFRKHGLRSPSAGEDLFEDQAHSVIMNVMDAAGKHQSDFVFLQKRMKSKKIISVLDSAHRGTIESDENGDLRISEDFPVRDKIMASNASMGVKAIELLKAMLSRGAIDENIFLVLDEPEIHLHPEWQIVYAQAIVLIAKNLGTKVLVTTHSPYFIQALYEFSRAYEMGKNMRVYSPVSLGDGAYKFKGQQEDGIADLLTTMAKPFDDIRRIFKQIKRGEE